MNHCSDKLWNPPTKIWKSHSFLLSDFSNFVWYFGIIFFSSFDLCVWWKEKSEGQNFWKKFFFWKNLFTFFFGKYTENRLKFFSSKIFLNIRNISGCWSSYAKSWNLEELKFSWKIFEFFIFGKILFRTKNEKIKEKEKNFDS